MKIPIRTIASTLGATLSIACCVSARSEITYHFDTRRDFKNNFASPSFCYAWAGAGYDPGVGAVAGKITVNQSLGGHATLVLTSQSYSFSRYPVLSFSVFFKSACTAGSWIKIGLMEEADSGLPTLSDSAQNAFIAVMVSQQGTYHDQTSGLSIALQSKDPRQPGTLEFMIAPTKGGNLNEWYQLTGRWSTNEDFSLYNWGTNGLGPPRLIGHCSTERIRNSRILSSSNLLFGIYGSAAWGLSIDEVTVTTPPIVSPSNASRSNLAGATVTGQATATGKFLLMTVFCLTSVVLLGGVFWWYFRRR